MTNAHTGCKRTFLPTIICLTILMTGGACVKTNISHFCKIANNCIVSEAQKDLTLDDFHITIKPEKQERICDDHKEFCNHPSNVDHQHDPDEAVSIISDIKMFCRIILKCYGDTLITGPTVDTKKWCPGAKMCTTDASIETSPDQSCCGSCSCESDCGLNNNCCYKTNDTHDVVHSENMKCVSIKVDRYDSISFYMIHTCANGSECLSSETILVPASSEMKRRLYINEACGRCNEVEDVTPWRHYLKCGHIADFTRLFRSGKYPADCSHTVKPSENSTLDWMMNFLCADDILRTCHPEYHNAKVIEACHTTNAIFRTRFDDSFQLFSNVFCVACNFYLHYRPSLNCPLFKTISITRKPYQPYQDMVVLLDTHSKRYIQQTIERASVQGGVCGQNMIRNVGQHPGCRPVLCPKGMLRLQDGSCRYIIKRWYFVTSLMQLTLRPLHEHNVTVSLLRNVSKESSIVQWTDAPCLTASSNVYWIYIVSDMQTNDTFVQELLVSIRNREVDVEPREYVSKRATCFENPWKLIVGNNHFFFSVELSTHMYKIRGGGVKIIQDKMSEMIVGTNTDIGIRPKKYEEIYYHKDTNMQSVYLIDPSINLNKLYFCNQVELDQTEIEIVGVQIRLIDNNVTLGNNRFDFYFKGDTNEFGVLVCVEDYPTANQSAVPIVRAGTICVVLVSLLFVHIW